jgi:hypothetical protein
LRDYVCRWVSNNIPLTPRFPICFFSYDFMTKISKHFSSLSCVLYVPLISCYTYLIASIIFAEKCKLLYSRHGTFSNPILLLPFRSNLRVSCSTNCSPVLLLFFILSHFTFFLQGRSSFMTNLKEQITFLLHIYTFTHLGRKVSLK